MQANSLSPFYSEVLEFLQKDAANAPLPLSEIIDNYQHLFGARGSIHLEKVLMEAFPAAAFAEHGLARYYPRIYRGLPRLYHRSSPTISQIKNNFTHLPSLKKQAVSRALFSLYAKFPVQGKVSLFTWRANEGDYFTASYAAKVLKARFPELEVHFISCEGDLSTLSAETLALMRSSDLILQMPVPVPELLETLQKIESSEPMPKMEWVGTSVEAEAHPKSGGYAMGLHFLEKGVLIRKLKQASWSQVKNEQLQQWRNPDNRFYLAHLFTPMGGAIYLHALLKSLENDRKDIDLCVPDLSWFIHYVEKQQKSGRSLLEWDLGVASIEVYFDGRYCPIPFSSNGKTVRLFCPASIAQADSLALLALSGDFAAVDDPLLALSIGKPFFYDGLDHHFMKDFVALAENRIGDHPLSLACIRGMNQSFLYNLPTQEVEWVDETFFQELEEPTSIALSMGLALQDPDVALGYKKLSQIIAAEFSANTFLCHLLQRALCHRKFPHIEELEAKELALFAANSQTFSQLIQHLSRALADSLL